MLSSPRDLGSQRGDAAPSRNTQLLKPLRLLTKATAPVTVRQPEGRGRVSARSPHKAHAVAFLKRVSKA